MIGESFQPQTSNSEDGVIVENLGHQHLVDLPDDAPRVFVRPSLNRDVAALLMLLFIIAIYHIQHPTLLNRAQFGRMFRGDSLQEGVALALVISVGFLLGSVGRLWDNRDTARGRLQIAFTAVIMLFALHGALMIFGDAHPFYEIYDISAEAAEDALAERDLVDPMKAFNILGLLAGASLVTTIYLWSPWDRLNAYQQGKDFREAIVFDLAALATLALIVITYHFQHPLLLTRSAIATDFQEESYQFVAVLALMITALLLMAPYFDEQSTMRQRGISAGMRSAFLLMLGGYLLHALYVQFADTNFITRYYSVTDPQSYETLLADGGLSTTIFALDRGSILGGMALASAFYLWAPWEQFNLYNDALRRNILPIIIALLTLVAWEGIVEWQDIKQFLLPRPSVIWETLQEDYPKIGAAGWFTFLNAFQGYLVGCGAGIITGIISARFTKFSAALLPLAIAANSIPIVAFAPIMNQWFGVTSPNSKIAIVAIMTYFPAMISTVRGLTAVNKTQLELMRSYAATEADIFRKLRLPNAFPFMFSALKLSTTLAMIGAIVSEFFGGSLAGLGYRIREDAALFDFPESWAAIIIASVFGIGFYLMIAVLERAAMPWDQSFRSET